MKSFKKVMAVGTMTLVLSATSLSAFAASIYKTPAEAVAGLTGRTVESVIAERIETGKTYGAIADEAGMLEEYKAESLEMKKDSLDAQVAAGRITQERADAILKAIEENQTVCNGTGTARIGQSMGAGFCGSGSGAGFGACGAGSGTGYGVGRGQGGGGGRGIGGMGLRDGSCYITSN